MIRFTFRQLTYFVAAAEAGSTSRAAEALGVSQPAISVAIAALEDLFGEPLFVRRRAHGIEPTPFGRRKLAAVRRLLAQAGTVEARAPEGELAGELEIGVFATLAPAHAPGLLAAFAAAHPAVEVRMRELTLDQIHRDLDSGVIELALLYDLDTIGEMVRTPLAAFAPYALLPEGHRLASRDRVSLAELADEPFVLIDLPHSRDYFLSLFRMVGVMPERVIRSASFETLRGLVAHGFGVSVLVTRPFGDRAHDGRPLVCRPLADGVPPQRLIVGTPVRGPVSDLVGAFVAVARAHFAGEPG